MEAALTKADVRAAAQALGLSAWDKPAAACLSSRVPRGVPITVEKLRRVEQAEAILQAEGFRQVRVRDHGDIARIEIAPEEFARLNHPALRASISARLREIGFRFICVDLDGLSSGGFRFPPRLAGCVRASMVPSYLATGFRERVEGFVSQPPVVRVRKASLDDFFGHHQRQIGRLSADLLNGLSPFVVDLTGRIAFDAVGFGNQPLLVFFHHTLRPFLRRRENPFGFRETPSSLASYSLSFRSASDRCHSAWSRLSLIFFSRSSRALRMPGKANL